MFVSTEILHQTLACSPVLCLQFLVGTFHGWMLPTMARLNDPNSGFHNVTADQASWFASLHEVGRLIGPFVSPLLVDNLGRKYTLVLVAVVYVVVWSSTIFAGSIYTLCALRVLFGLGNAINDVASGIYTTENCSPHMRGIVGSFVLLIFFVAVFVECIIATYLPSTTTAVVNTLMAGCAFATTLYYCVETPSFLIVKGKREKAEKNLIWLYGKTTADKMTDEELQGIEQSIAQQKSKKRSFAELLSSPDNVKRIVLVVTMNVLAMATGASAFGNYASVIFQPSETFTTGEYTILYGAMSLVGVVASVFVIERIDRRSLVVAGNAGCALCNISAFFLIYFRGRGHECVAYPWLIFASVASFNMFGALTAPAAFALRGELLPFSVRAIGNSMAVVGFSISSFTVSKTFLPVTERFGMETNFLAYAVAGLFTTVFFYYCLPETRGKTLHELQNLQKSEPTITDKKRSGEVGVKNSLESLPPSPRVNQIDCRF